MGIAKGAAGKIAPQMTKVAPNITSAFVHQALDLAIGGSGPLPGAAAAADKQLAKHGGDREKAIDSIREQHMRYAAAQGFVTNLGGLVTMAVTIPANISGLAMLECRMVAAIMSLRGYDLDDPRTRAAILTCLLGEERLGYLIKKKKIPGTPMAVATAPVPDPEIARLVANEVATELITQAAGKRLATTVGRRMPIIGGAVGAGSDGWTTWQIGRYAEREFLPRARR